MEQLSTQVVCGCIGLKPTQMVPAMCTFLVVSFYSSYLTAYTQYYPQLLRYIYATFRGVYDCVDVQKT